MVVTLLVFRVMILSFISGVFVKVANIIINQFNLQNMADCGKWIINCFDCTNANGRINSVLTPHLENLVTFGDEVIIAAKPRREIIPFNRRVYPTKKKEEFKIKLQSKIVASFSTPFWSFTQCHIGF